MNTSTTAKSYSAFGEQQIIADWLSRLAIANRFCVDVGAADGRWSSNSLALYEGGWDGLSIECSPAQFAKLERNYEQHGVAHVKRACEKVFPNNIVSLLAQFDVPRDPGFLSLDIDSWDHDVLDAILGAYRPGLICAEINEKIPPPIKFSVRVNPDHVWSEDHFYGQSLSMLNELCVKHDYALVQVEYANAFLVAKELSPIASRDPQEAYQAGYADRPERFEKFPWNKDVEILQTMNPVDAVWWIGRKFAKYTGKFVCEVDSSIAQAA